MPCDRVKDQDVMVVAAALAPAVTSLLPSHCGSAVSMATARALSLPLAGTAALKSAATAKRGHYRKEGSAPHFLSQAGRGQKSKEDTK